jgi:hypothetical protein
LPPKPVFPHFLLEDEAGNSISSFSLPECTFSPVRTTQQSANINIKLKGEEKMDIFRTGLKLLQVTPQEDSVEEEVPIAIFIQCHQRKSRNTG